MPTVTIKKMSSNEPNVSLRHITYDIYVDGKYVTTKQDINDALDEKERLEKGKQNSFTNGRAKAQQEIANKWPLLNAKTVTYYRGSDGTCYDVEDGWSGAHSIRVEAPRKMMLERMTPEQFNSFKSSRGLQVISKQECDKK